MSFQLSKLLAASCIVLASVLALAIPGAGSEFGQSSGLGLGEQTQKILPVDDAFVLQTLRSEGKIEVLWRIHPGYYLYRHRLAVSGSKRLGEASIPAGLAKTDEFFGDVEVYYDGLIIEVPIKGTKPEEITVEYQGCSDDGICYPPQKRRINL
jgi:thiol:disulfide interchange protein DsbD